MNYSVLQNSVYFGALNSEETTAIMLNMFEQKINPFIKHLES